VTFNLAYPYESKNLTAGVNGSRSFMEGGKKKCCEEKEPKDDEQIVKIRILERMRG
jgi:hypothetical protein